MDCAQFGVNKHCIRLNRGPHVRYQKKEKESKNVNLIIQARFLDKVKFFEDLLKNEPLLP